MVSAGSFDASGITFESLNKSCFYYNTQGRRCVFRVVLYYLHKDWSISIMINRH